MISRLCVQMWERSCNLLYNLCSQVDADRYIVGV
eukprot:COSAG06_NODE_67372_length_252_cov_0.673203_1_plen_33_part_10